MNVLEKILEEIEQEKLKHWDSSERLETDKLMGWCFDKCTEIIRKHMADAPENDGWIPVEERLPEEDESVLCCSDDERMMIGVLHKEYYIDFGIAVAENYNQTMHGVIAWQPPPEPYRPEGSDEE